MIEIKEIEEFRKIIETKEKVLVDFYADWCGPCKMLKPVLEEVAKEQEDLTIIEVNTDLFHNLAREYKVLTIPALKLFEKGELIKEKSGLMRKEELIEWLEDR